MIENSIAFFLLGNSVLTIGLILNQNESKKESPSSFSPLEPITWICIGLQFLFLLLKTKISA